MRPGMAQPVKEDTSEVLARWLQEVGRRTSRAARRGGEPEPRAPEPPRTTRGHARQIALFGVLALAFLQYYALDVMVQIYSLPSIVVFVPTRV
jgi:hypothetical protein